LAAETGGERRTKDHDAVKAGITAAKKKIKGGGG